MTQDADNYRSRMSIRQNSAEWLGGGIKASSVVVGGPSNDHRFIDKYQGVRRLEFEEGESQKE